jgi:MFS transporter, ACS family, glucarate transporter
MPGPAPRTIAWPRYLVIAALFCLSLITYIDRAAISTAKGPIAGDLGLSDAQMGLVFSAFALGYAAAQVPSGWVADRIGPRRALAIAVLLWSGLTALTGAISQLGPMLAVRFLFGVAEAGAYPGSARVFYNWLPAGMRGVANGVLFSGGLVGAAIAFPICVWLLERFEWRGAFYALGVPGVIWALCWLIWFRDHPRQPIARDEPPAADQPTVAGVLWSRPMRLAMFQYFAGNFTFYICISWMHPYLMEHYGLAQGEAARYAMIPLLCGASANWVAGLLVDALYRSPYRAWSRRVPGMGGFLLASLGVLWVWQADGPTSAIVGFAIATFGVEMTISPSWAFCLDIGGRSAGTISAAMNMAGNLGGVASTNAFPLLRHLTGAPGTYFVVAALLNALAILCWRLMPPAGTAPKAHQPAPGVVLAEEGRP